MSKEAVTKDELLARLQSIEWSDIKFKEAAWACLVHRQRFCQYHGRSSGIECHAAQRRVSDVLHHDIARALQTYPPSHYTVLALPQIEEAGINWAETLAG